MKHHYIVHRTNGQRDVLTTEKPAALEELQAWVGGYVEFVQDGKYHLCINEEGQLNHLPGNPSYMFLVGDVVQGVMQDTEEGQVFIGAGRSEER